MNKPEITIHHADGTASEVREMTDEEYAQYEADIANAEPLASAE
jgi:hypothetical protein